MGSTASIVYFILVFRCLNASLVTTFFQPDEYYQSLEPAWQLAFGPASGAWLTWVSMPLSMTIDLKLSWGLSGMASRTAFVASSGTLRCGVCTCKLPAARHALPSTAARRCLGPSAPSAPGTDGRGGRLLYVASGGARVRSCQWKCANDGASTRFLRGIGPCLYVP